MKIIYLVSFNGIGENGGVERVCYYLYQILTEKYKVVLITAPKIPLKLRFFVAPFILSFNLLFLKNRFVISNSWQLFPFKADVSIHHGTTAGIMRELGINTFGSKCIAKMEQWSAKNAKNVIAVSRNCANELHNIYGIKNEKIITLPNFVDDKIFKPAKIEEETDCINVLFIGTLCERKGLSALKQFSDYIETKKNIKLNIACNNSENTKLFKNNEKTIIRVGLDINQIADFYRQGDIFYFPSKYEGFSMSTLEALSSGCPVIGSNYAIAQELEQYDFCKVITDYTPENVYSEIEKLYRTFKYKKNEIHEQISKDFGKKQYEEKLLKYINIKINGDKND